MFGMTNMDTIDFVALESCPVYSSFFGAMGCASAIVLTVFGAAYGTAKSSVAIFHAGVLRPERLMQNVICPIMAQILSIYGLVVAVIISGRLDKRGLALHNGFLFLAAGTSVGLCGLAAGFAIGVIGDSGVRASTQQPRLYVGMILILIFAEVLGLYGTIIAIMLVSNAVPDCTF
ncbi:V-type ATPase [Colletotrichum karsti]|uniref:V-type proton ATPase proteolipid subunit n=1 Tax=Colletotrichum karsti TaxID=1095194 RepID=A0A9P6I3F6_9PEZI|nr:V-type ATPase [Colletotrichum karsti]KAF9875539.1 V-type ATPase [Colletotrichum karsti]